MTGGFVVVLREFLGAGRDGYEDAQEDGYQELVHLCLGEDLPG